MRRPSLNPIPLELASFRYFPCASAPDAWPLAHRHRPPATGHRPPASALEPPRCYHR